VVEPAATYRDGEPQQAPSRSLPDEHLGVVVHRVSPFPSTVPLRDAESTCFPHLFQTERVDARLTRATEAVLVDVLRPEVLVDDRCFLFAEPVECAPGGTTLTLAQYPICSYRRRRDEQYENSDPEQHL